jgi:hypothetical protein
MAIDVERENPDEGQFALRDRAEEEASALSTLADLEDIEFVLEEIENKIAPLALALAFA